MNGNTAGWGSGFLGVLIFSASMPATRAAVAGFPPLFLTSIRAAIAAALAAILLMALRAPRPTRQEIVPLIVVAVGVVLGFPLLSALALTHITAAHSIVFIGLLPLTTAGFGVWRAGERPKPLFWLFALAGAAAVAGFAWATSPAGELTGDALMLAAIVICGLGYAEGARLSRHLGGWQVISWALVLAFPVMAAIAVLAWPANLLQVPFSAWAGLAYVSVFSMLVGFVFWYRGLALGGIAKVGQLQLLQPFFGLMLSALLLGESVSPGMIAAALAVMLCVAGSRRFA